MSSWESAELIDGIAKRYGFYSSIVILFFGIIGNSFIILIFTTLPIFRGNRSAYYLSVESTTNIGVLLAVLPSNIATNVLSENPANTSIVWCKLQLMSSYSFGSYSLYIICFLALDQFLSTNHRQSWRQKSTLQLAHRLTLFNISLSVFHGILFLVFAEIGPEGCTVYHPIIKLYFAFFMYPVLYCTLPFLLSGLLSLLAYRNVRRIVRLQVPLVRRRLDQEMTAIALARVVCIVGLAAPFIVSSLMAFNMNYADANYMQRVVFSLFSLTASLLLYSNFSISFYVFLIISPRFRRQVKQFLAKRCWCPVRKLFVPILSATGNNQIVPEDIQRNISTVELD